MIFKLPHVFNFLLYKSKMRHTSHLESKLTLDIYNSNGIFYLCAFTIHAKVLGLRNAIGFFSLDKKYFFTF